MRRKPLPFICEQQIVSGWERCAEQCEFCRAIQQRKRDESPLTAAPSGGEVTEEMVEVAYRTFYGTRGIGMAPPKMSEGARRDWKLVLTAALRQTQGGA